MKKLLQVLFACCLLIFLFQPAKIVQASTADAGQDFIFVIDGSYSMNTNDPQKHIFELMRSMSSLSEGTANRIGYVIYNDSIIKDQELKKIANEQETAQMLAGVTSLTRIKGTDIGLGMKTANRILKESDYEPSHTAMIVLSDGDVEVDAANPNRTQQDADKDVQAVVENADYPIYTVQYSEVARQNQAPMNTWGAKTGGANYSATTVQELSQRATDIYNRQAKMSLTEKKEKQVVQPKMIQKKATQEKAGFPVWLIIAASILILAVICYYIWRFIKRAQAKKRSTYFHDALEGYFMKTPTGEDIPIQNWNASMFHDQSKVTLFDLLQSNPMQTYMQASKHVKISISTHNHLEITNKSADIEVIQNGQPVAKKKPCRLKSSESLYLIFHESGVEIELRIRKASYKG